MDDEHDGFGPTPMDHPPLEEENEEGDELEDVTPQVPNHLLPMNKRVILDQERFLPIANISRIMKRLLPSSGKVAKEAKECVQECVSEFISFLTSEACDRCKEEKRKTISADDLMKSLINMGFDEYVEPMEIFMRRYREINRIPPRPPFAHSTAPTYPSSVAVHANPTLSQPIALTLPQSRPTVVPSICHVQMATNSNVTSPVQISSSSKTFSTMSAPQETSQPQSFTVVSAQPANGNPPPNSLEPLQLMVDPQTNQHYMVVDNADGSRELRPVQLVTGDMTPFDGPSTSSTPPQFAVQSPVEQEKPFTTPGPIKTPARSEKFTLAPYSKSKRH